MAFWKNLWSAQYSEQSMQLGEDGFQLGGIFRGYDYLFVLITFEIAKVFWAGTQPHSYEMLPYVNVIFFFKFCHTMLMIAFCILLSFHIRGGFI